MRTNQYRFVRHNVLGRQFHFLSIIRSLKKPSYCCFFRCFLNNFFIVFTVVWLFDGCNAFARVLHKKLILWWWRWWVLSLSSSSSFDCAQPHVLLTVHITSKQGWQERFVFVETCQSEFGFKLPTILLACRKEKKLCKINQCDNYMLRLFRSVLCMHCVFMFALFNWVRTVVSLYLLPFVVNKRRIYIKQFQNFFETVLKLFCFSLFSLCGPF